MELPYRLASQRSTVTNTPSVAGSRTTTPATSFDSTSAQPDLQRSGQKRTFEAANGATLDKGYSYGYHTPYFQPPLQLKPHRIPVLPSARFALPYERNAQTVDVSQAAKQLRTAKPSDAISFHLLYAHDKELTECQTCMLRWPSRVGAYHEFFPGRVDLLPTYSSDPAFRLGGEAGYDVIREQKCRELWHREEAKHVQDLGGYRAKPLHDGQKDYYDISEPLLKKPKLS
ncbi:uncharacterized protein LY89DRAFT_758332 [Mollisia scopiformis]|uniref:Uncharacterized protein n=1 Tax=Mollisia scopiformis TaxID=149040 RepID=A0A194WUI2_MOLSC|nr:uncharacterized protein LY89DRAFT_758332 [Mollisia scopiformis]KUJ11623.1 hypothetical protein LY89DRAFT_758332 [Mollisia scopiformis]